MSGPSSPHGRYYEDFEVGDVYQSLGRTISETDNTWFTLLTGNTNEMHFNRHYAERSTFGKLLVNSAFSVAVVVGLSVRDVSQKAMANLGWESIELPHPVFIGDTLYAESLVLGLRPSASRPYAGIVTVRTHGLNQDGDVCVRFTRSILTYRRGNPYDEDVFPVAKQAISADV